MGERTIFYSPKSHIIGQAKVRGRKKILNPTEVRGAMINFSAPRAASGPTSTVFTAGLFSLKTRFVTENLYY